MDHNIVPLTFPVSGDAVRVVWLDNEPWWVAADVCRELDIKSPRHAVRGLDAGDGVTTTVPDPGGVPQETYVVNEAGLYQLIFQSRKAQAKIFKRWIFEQVLPAIRQTGSYESAEAREAKVLELLEVGDAAYRRIENAAQRKEIPSWVAQQFADSQGLLTDALGFPAVLTTSGRIDDENGLEADRNTRLTNGQRRSVIYKKVTGRLPFKAPTFRRGKYRIVNHFPKSHALAIEGFRDRAPKAIEE